MLSTLRTAFAPYMELEWKKECLPAVSGEPVSVVLKPACAPVNWLCSLAVLTSTLRFQSSFHLVLFRGYFILAFRVAAWHSRGSSFLIMLLHPSWTAAPSKETHRVHGHLLVVLSLCVPSDPVFYATKALPPTDDITFRLSISSFPHNSHFSFLFLALFWTWTLFTPWDVQLVVSFLPLPSLLYWLVFCLTLCPSLVSIHPLLLFPIWCWETHLSKSQFPDSEWVPY